MISGFRKSLRSWATVLLLFIALVAIVVTGFGTGGFGGIGNLGGGPAPDQLAKVNGAAITTEEIRNLVNRNFEQARQGNPTLDMATFVNGGGYQGALQQTILARAIRDYAQARGISVSETMIDREIVNIPAFRNFAGRFDQSTFQATLARLNISEAQLRDDIARSMYQRQLLAPVALGGRVPEGVARAYADLLLERRRGLIGALPTQMFAAGINPSEAQVASFYRQNAAAFTLPERRAFKYALIGPEQVAAATAASEAEIARVYQNSQALYGPRETRTLQAIVLPTQQAAQAFAARVRGGASFVEAAGQAGFAPTDVTFADQRREQFATATNAEIAAAAFAAAEGAVLGPTRSPLGFHVIRIERISRTPGRPLESVRADIARTIAVRKRDSALNALVGRIEEQLADGTSIDDVARAAGLTLVSTPAVTAAGQAPADPAWRPAQELRAVLGNAFEIDPDDPQPAIEQLPGQPRFVLLGLARVEPAAPPPLAQIRDRVRAAFITREASRRARAAADRIVARINAGTPAERAFAEAQPRLPEVQRVEMQRLQISRGGQQVPPPLLTLFNLPQGKARAQATPDRAGFFVVAHLQRTPGNAGTNRQLIAATQQQFNTTISEELAEEFARAIERDSRIERNDEAIRRQQRQLGGALPSE